MQDYELQIIEQLTGVSANQITLADDGFWSRGYIIDGGRIVFKFKKSPKVSYYSEIKALEFVNSLGLNINLQKVGWVSPDDSYLGAYGVAGRSLELLSNLDHQSIGRQLGTALWTLHQARPEGIEAISLDDEIATWQERYQKSHDQLRDYFSDEEIAIFDKFIFETIPTELKRFGEKMVCSHGDLGDGNIFVDDNGKVGVIDFGEMCYLDEAGDFMDVNNKELRLAMLDAYGADEVLREKVRLRVLVRPLFVLGDYIRRGDMDRVRQLVVDCHNIIMGKEKNLKPKYATRTVLLDENGKVAIINVTKHGYYKIPGGGIEEQEEIEVAARREVMEEAGCDCRIVADLGRIESEIPVWGLYDISEGFIAHVVGEKMQPKYEDWENERGFRIEWYDDLDAAIARIEQNVVSEPGMDVLQERDLAFLKRAREKLAESELTQKP